MLRTGVVSPEAVPQALEALERNARAQSQLVDDLLDMSRIISGKLVIRREPVSMDAIVEGAIDTIRPIARGKDVALSADVTDRSRLAVVGDPDRLRQVLWNLLSNAVKFTPAGGRVLVRAFAEDDAAVVVVQDTGEGIESGFLPFVFERFRQADSTTTRRHNGLGLGLAIARHLIEAHEGTIAAHSDGPDKGATFTVRLPIHRGNTRSTGETQAVR
jgi:signal transduction histidine kinase